MIRFNERPVRREVAQVRWNNLTQGKALCVEADADGITLWAKRSRYRRRLPWEMVADLAARAGTDTSNKGGSDG